MANANRISAVVETIKAARERSELCWEMAADTADNATTAAEWQSQGEACDEHYSDALGAIENGDYAAAIESLEQARSLESDGGDDQHAREAIAAVKSLFDDMVMIEEMPDHHRGSHRAAGNWGAYPHNGATRRRVSRDEAEQVVADDPDGYARIIEVQS